LDTGRQTNEYLNRISKYDIRYANEGGHMKNLFVFIAALAAFIFLTSVESQAGRFERRDSRQYDRIEAGIARGEITQREARILRNEQDNICELRERSMRDGHLSDRERIRLERRQDLASRHIHRFNHNRAERRDRHDYDREDISFNRSSVVIPLILPPLPPPPLVFPGMHILFHHIK
jgi:hypothetical protein